MVAKGNIKAQRTRTVAVSCIYIPLRRGIACVFLRQTGLDLADEPRAALPFTANEVIKAELDQMERISVKWSESQYLPSPARLPPLNNYRAEEQKRAVTDRFYFSRPGQSC